MRRLRGILNGRRKSRSGVLKQTVSYRPRTDVCFGAGRTRTGEQKWLIRTTIKEAAAKEAAVKAAVKAAAKVAVIKVAATKVVVIRVAAKVAAIKVAAKVAAIRAANHCR